MRLGVICFHPCEGKFSRSRVVPLRTWATSSMLCGDIIERCRLFRLIPMTMPGPPVVQGYVEPFALGFREAGTAFM